MFKHFVVIIIIITINITIIIIIIIITITQGRWKLANLAPTEISLIFLAALPYCL